MSSSGEGYASTEMAAAALTVTRRQTKAQREAPARDDQGHHVQGHHGDDAPSSALSHEEILRQIMTRLTVEVEVAGAAVGLGRNAAYKAVHAGELPSLRLGHKLVCPTAPLRRMLQLDPSDSATPIAAPPIKPKQSKVRKARRSSPR
jgi:hypothetical protein